MNRVMLVVRIGPARIFRSLAEKQDRYLSSDSTSNETGMTAKVTVCCPGFFSGNVATETAAKSTCGRPAGGRLRRKRTP